MWIIMFRYTVSINIYIQPIYIFAEMYLAASYTKYSSETFSLIGIPDNYQIVGNGDWMTALSKLSNDQKYGK